LVAWAILGQDHGAHCRAEREQVSSANTVAETGTEHAPVILLVEDEVLIRLSTAEFLRGEGYVVLEASDAVEALVLFTSEHPLDLVVTDVRMPGELDGVKLTQILKEARPQLPVALASAHLALDVGHPGDRFLRKPYTPNSCCRWWKN
jgi:CheY-like chemotaxis protein